MYDGVSSKVEGDSAHVTKRVWALDPVDGTKGRIFYTYCIYLCIQTLSCIYLYTTIMVSSCIRLTLTRTYTPTILSMHRLSTRRTLLHSPRPADRRRTRIIGSRLPESGPK